MFLAGLAAYCTTATYKPLDLIIQTSSHSPCSKIPVARFEYGYYYKYYYYYYYLLEVVYYLIWSIVLPVQEYRNTVPFYKPKFPFISGGIYMQLRLLPLDPGPLCQTVQGRTSVSERIVCQLGSSRPHGTR